MGSLIGVLSTVILVSTVCTLIFAVGAYVISRKGRTGVGTIELQNIPGTDVSDQFPKPAADNEAAPKLFKRAKTGPAAAADEPVDDEYQWK